MPVDPKTIYNRNRSIERARKKTGLSSTEMAKILGLNNYNAYRRYETGERIPSILNLITMSLVFGVSIDEIVGLKPPKDEQNVKGN